jgi:predicted phage terminase large subunit-like protein
MSAALDIDLATILRIADPASNDRAALETHLGMRSFRAFFRMAWPFMDPAHLLWNWHIDLLCDEMERVARREVTEAVFCVPPRSLKSQIMSVAFPAWVWTWFPAAKFICGSNEMTLATRDAVRMRQLVKGDWYQRRWGQGSPFLKGVKLTDDSQHPGVGISGDQDNKTYFETSAGGHRFCCTPGSNVTGHGGDFVLVDDPHPTQKAESAAQRLEVQRWWWEAIPTRLNEPDRGVKMIVQQRVHREDLAGSAIERGYHAVVLPMEFEGNHPQRHPRDPRQQEGELLHPERTGPVALKKLKTALGSYGTAGQLQQRPAPREGGLFKRAWFQVVDAAPAECFHSAVRRWDLAGTVPEPGKDPDWTAGAKVAKDAIGRIFVMNIQRFQSTPAKVDAAIRAIAQQDGSSVKIGIPQDPGQAGVAQAAALTRFLAPYQVAAYRETGSKADRARGFASQCEAGNVYLVRGGWNEAFLEEVCEFPNGSHDDQLDAVVGGFEMLFTSTTGLLDWYASQSGD